MDYRPAMAPRTGIGRYAASLAAALAARRDCAVHLLGVFLRGNKKELRRAPEGARLVAWRVPSRALDLLGLLRVLPADRAVGGCDVFHHTNYLMARVSPSTPQVMTLHDLAFLKDPSCHTPRAAAALRRIVGRALRRCAAFLVPSEATAGDCEELLHVPRDRLFVTPLGVAPDFFEPAGAAPSRPYLLAVGTLEPRKNHLRLLRAFARVRADVELVLAGKPGWLCAPVLELAAATPRVRVLGHVEEPRLRALLAHAEAVLYPSLLEGFGLPVLEAMAAGRPVLASDREPLRSLAAGAALLVDPEDEDAIAAGIARLLGDGELRARLAAEGPRRARAFPWERCAETTLQAYEAVLA
jgi:glycosyltransferase involved in cell wall biosynthesis